MIFSAHPDPSALFDARNCPAVSSSRDFFSNLLWSAQENGTEKVRTRGLRINRHKHLDVVSSQGAETGANAYVLAICDQDKRLRLWSRMAHSDSELLERRMCSGKGCTRNLNPHDHRTIDIKILACGFRA
jgi:hypothetical protein